MSELTLRILSALVAVPVVVATVYLGDAALASLLGVTAALACWELFRMAERTGARPIAWLGIPLAAAVPLAVHGYQLRLFGPPLALAVLIPLVVLGVAIWARGVAGRPLASAAVTVFGIVYVGATLSFAYGLRYHRFAIGALAGSALVLLPVVLTWGSDTGAYFAGRTFGKRKLIPSVSPGKTVAGAVGGLIATVIVAYLYSRFALRPAAQLALSPWGAVIFGTIISVAAQVGDLAESLLKREADVKDSSRLIPGHGGVLDRVDSLLFTLPVGYLLADLLLLPAPL